MTLCRKGSAESRTPTSLDASTALIPVRGQGQSPQSSKRAYKRHSSTRRLLTGSVKASLRGVAAAHRELPVPSNRRVRTLGSPDVKTPYPLLCGLLLSCPGAFAEQQVFMTIDPNTFAPGQNLSNAATGAVLRAVTAVLNPDPNPPPGFTYVLHYSPSVFAQSVTAGCVFEGIPCAATGNLEFGWDATLPLPSTQPIVWGSGQSAAACLTSFCDSTSAFGLDHPALRIDFSVPTDHVSS